MRILSKGGIWRNTEDEILKAAVMKYGKNQWSRISSLLTRKSAKQCKARWYEWLDPSIKKTEWSREEEERLLHLAKLMPCQWKTISQIGKDNERVDPSEDPRRLRPGEIDPNPESKPCKWDTVDMDEDEKEMLSEAIARLANTKGKKAKRKARERMLEESRRLSSLQKRRELKAAGIDLPFTKRPTKGVDYNQEIPFERTAPVGFHDLSGETPVVNDEEFLNQFLQKFDPKRRKQQEERQKQKEDSRKFQSLREENLPAAVLKFNRLTEGKSEKKRGALALPAPQVVKTGFASEAAAAELESGPAATRTLLPSFSGAATPTPLLTPRTPQLGNYVQETAQDLIAMTTAQTPLLGGSNPTVHSVGVGATPGRKEAATPNVVLRATLGATPSRAVVAAEEPGRPPSEWDTPTPAGAPTDPSPAASTRDDRRLAKAIKRQQIQQLNAQFAALPAPQNAVRIVEPEVPPEEEDEQPTTGPRFGKDGVIADDAGEVAEWRRKERERLESANVSTAVQRQLPRPSAGPATPELPAPSATAEAQARTLIAAEAALLARRDAREHPYPTAPKKKSTKKGRAEEEPVEPIAPADLEQAKALIAEATTESPEPPFDTTEFGEAWAELHGDLWLIPGVGFVRATNATPKQKLESLMQQFEALRDQLQKKAKKGLKLESELRAACAAQTAHIDELAAQCRAAEDEILSARLERASFERLAEAERAALPRRLEVLRTEVAAVQARERALQLKYSALKEEMDAMVEAGIVRVTWAPANGLPVLTPAPLVTTTTPAAAGPPTV